MADPIQSTPFRGGIFTLLLLVSFCVICLAVFLVLLRGPEEQAMWYADTAVHIQARSLRMDTAPGEALKERKMLQQKARNLFLQALSIYPYNPYLWLRFAKMTADQNGACEVVCQKALIIAETIDPSLQQNIADMQKVLAEPADEKDGGMK